MYTPKIQNTDNTKGWQGCGATGILFLWCNIKWYSQLEDNWQFLIKFNTVSPYNPAISGYLSK